MANELISKLYINSIIERKQKLFQNTLEPYGRKVYSQTDEDGILEEIIFRMNKNQTDLTFVEIGVGSGTENNTLKLLAEGAKGVWIEGDSQKAKSCLALTHKFVEEKRLLILNAMADINNLKEICSKVVEQLGTNVIDVFSIDVDGPDYELTELMLSENLLLPEIIVCEYNGRFGPSIIANDDYTNNVSKSKLPPHLFYGTGSSLNRWVNLLRNYKLVACGILGINAFFVRADKHDSYKFPNTNIREIYNPLELRPWIEGGFKQLHGFPSHFSTYN